MTEENKSTSTFRLHLEGPGVSIDKMVDARVAGAIANLAFIGIAADPTIVTDMGGGPPSTIRSAAIRSQSTSILDQRLSLREYLQGADVSRGIHGKILAVGRYMRDHEQQGEFGRDDIRSRFRSAGEPQPANFHRDFQKAIREGWIAEDHQNSGRFYVTRSGDEEIDRRQHGQPATSRGHKPRRRTRLLPPASEGSMP